MLAIPFVTYSNYSSSKMFVATWKFFETAYNATKIFLHFLDSFLANLKLLQKEHFGQTPNFFIFAPFFTKQNFLI